MGGCWCLFLLMTKNPLKNIKGCQCLFLLTTGNTLKISGTKFFRYRFRDFFPVPIFSDTGSDTTKNMKNSRYREFPVTVRQTLLSTIYRVDFLTVPTQKFLSTRKKQSIRT